MKGVTYIDQRVWEALQEAEGNRRKATEILLGWCVEDELLKDGLTSPFLESAATYHVSRVAHAHTRPTQSSTGRDEISPATLDHLIDQLRENTDNQPSTFADAARATPRKSKKASADHKNSMQNIAGAFKGKKE